MSSTALGRARFTRALRSRDFALLWLGQTISSLGDGAFATALGWQVLLLTRSAGAMGAVLVAEALPRVVFLLFGGVLADRLPKRLMLLWSDGGRALAVVVIALLGWTHVLQLWHLVALGLVFGFAQAFFIPAYQAFPSQLVLSEDLLSANALTGLSRNMALLLGPAIGAALVAAFDPAGAFAFDGLSFALSALCLIAMRRPHRQPREEPNPMIAGATESIATMTLPDAPGGGGMLGEVREGFGYVMRQPWLWITIAIASLGNIGVAPLQVAAPRLVHDVYHQGVWLLGALFTVNAVGAIAATLVLGQLHRVRHRGVLGYVALAAGSVGLLVLGLPLPSTVIIVVALGGMFVFGASSGIFDIVWVSSLQEMVPQAKLGRVSSIDWLGSFCLLPIGLAVTGVLADRLGPAWVFVAGGAMNTLIVLLGLLVPAIRRMD